MGPVRQNPMQRTVKWAQWDKTQSRELLVCSYVCAAEQINKLECGPMPNLMVALLKIGGALCSTP